jgi:hypothetical protein
VKKASIRSACRTGWILPSLIDAAGDREPFKPQREAGERRELKQRGELARRGAIASPIARTARNTSDAPEEAGRLSSEGAARAAEHEHAPCCGAGPTSRPRARCSPDLQILVNDWR